MDIYQEEEMKLVKEDKDKYEGVQGEFIEIVRRKREWVETPPKEKKNTKKRQQNNNTNTHDKETIQDKTHRKAQIVFEPSNQDPTMETSQRE